MGTPEIAAVILKKILDSGKHEVVLAVTQPDRPRGRGNNVAMSEVKTLALEHEIPVFTPEKIKDPESVEELRKYEADIFVVAAFGQILSSEILNMPKYGCVNVHASLLPKYRGAAPIQWAILDGQLTTGITIMQMDEGLDTGDIIIQEEIRIPHDETAGGLHDTLAELGGDMILKALTMIEDGTATRTPQGPAKTHYATMLNKSMGKLDFTRSARELDRYVRGLNPWPSAYAYLEGRMIKIWDTMITDKCEDGLAPGDVYGIDKNGFYIATGEGGLRVLALQPEGKRQMTAAEFMRGYDIYGKHFE